MNKAADEKEGYQNNVEVKASKPNVNSDYHLQRERGFKSGVRNAKNART